MRPNVLHLVCSFHQGGSERQAIQLTRLLLASDRYNVHTAVLDPTGVLRADMEALGFNEIPQFPLTSFYDLNFLKQLRRFVSFLKEREIDIFQSSDFYTNIFGLLGAAIAGVPVRIGARRETTGWRNRAQKIAERHSYRFAHAVVANAGAVKALLIEEGVPEKKIVTIYNGLDTSRVELPAGYNRDEALAMIGLPPSSTNRYVTMVANLRSPIKNYPMFIRAAKIVRDAVPDARFIIAGEGELLEPMRELAASLGLGPYTYFLGRCQKVAELLALSEVCAFSSSHEGFSNSILEYMAAAKPVVVTEAGGAREAVIEGETGYVVKLDDHQQMAARIITILSDSERGRAMGRLGERIVREKFSCETQIQLTHKLYEQLLTRDTAAGANSQRSAGKIGWGVRK